jgi:hypothetical protein
MSVPAATRVTVPVKLAVAEVLELVSFDNAPLWSRRLPTVMAGWPFLTSSRVPMSPI